MERCEGRAGDLRLDWLVATGKARLSGANLE